MNKIVITLAIALTGCGISERISSSCGGDLEHLCESILGDTQDQINNNRDDIKELQLQVAALQQELDIQIDLLIQANINQDEINNNQDVEINNQQVLINQLLVDMVEVKTRITVAEIIDPCNNNVGYDEVLIRLSDNSLIAYFESGSNRFLTKLTPGSYRTTDTPPYCYFTVNSNLDIVW
jgi:hypothetical protein